MTDPADTVREALDGISSFADDVGPAYAALDALVAERDEARRNVRGLMRDPDENVRWLDLMESRAEAAEDDLRATEKLATDERERRIAAEAENAKMKALLYEDDGLNGVVPQLHRAEARVAQLEKALRDLLPWAGRQTFENDTAWIAARAALAGEGGDRDS